jgi:hypothetical protein
MNTCGSRAQMRKLSRRSSPDRWKRKGITTWSMAGS